MTTEAPLLNECIIWVVAKGSAAFIPSCTTTRDRATCRRKHDLYQPRAIPSLLRPINTHLPDPNFLSDCQWAQRVWSDISTAESMSLGPTPAHTGRSCPQPTSSALAEARKGRRCAGDETVRYANLPFKLDIIIRAESLPKHFIFILQTGVPLTQAHMGRICPYYRV